MHRLIDDQAIEQSRLTDIRDAEELSPQKKSAMARRTNFPGMKRKCKSCDAIIVITEKMTEEHIYKCEDCWRKQRKIWRERNLLRVRQRRAAERESTLRETFPEGAKWCPSYPGYAVTDSGNVWSSKYGRWSRHTERMTRCGYYAVNLCINGKMTSAFLHCLVLDAFAGPRPFPEAHSRHLDGNKLNNHISNLRWGTRSENERDKFRHGTHHFIALNQRRKCHSPQTT